MVNQISLSVRLAPIVLFALALSSCLQYQSRQDGLNPKQVLLVNPTPLVKNPELSNRQHEILIGVIDTGVDYNHPYLVNSVHYQLDQQGRVLGTGWDFFGGDALPAPYLARTADNQKGLSFEAKSKVKQARKLAQKMIKKYPSLADKLDPDRAVEEEFINGAYHGTHVAGLASYNEPRIGIVPLRVNLAFPGNLGFDKQQAAIDSAVDSMIAALKKGYTLGARIFNMSLAVQAMLNGKNINQTSDLSSKQKEEYSKVKAQIYQLNQKRVEKFTRFLSQYPGLIIVASSGNAGVYLEEDQANSLPCGVRSQQVVCVGSVNQSLDRVSGFSNIPKFRVPFIFAPGEQMMSTFPTLMCASSMNRFAKSFLPWFLSSISTVSDEENWNNFAKGCLVKRLLVPSDGTSMASPVAARGYAKFILDNKYQIGADSLEKYTKSLKRIEFRGHPFPVVDFEQPKWMSLQ